jgi:hypothetical protein
LPRRHRAGSLGLSRCGTGRARFRHGVYRANPARPPRHQTKGQTPRCLTLFPDGGVKQPSQPSSGDRSSDTPRRYSECIPSGAPMRRGQPRSHLLRETQAGPGGGPACVIWRGSRTAGRMPMRVPTPRPGTDGNHSCGFERHRGGPRTAASSLVSLTLFMHHSSFHPAGDDDDLTGDVTRQLV